METQKKFKPQNKYVSGIACAVASCGVTKRSHPNRKLYNFPNQFNQSLFEEWKQRCCVPESRLKKKLMICDKHFKDDVKGKSRLKKCAIPELHLPTNTTTKTVKSVRKNRTNESAISKTSSDNEVKEFVENSLKNIKNEIQTATSDNSDINPHNHHTKTYLYEQSSPQRDLTIEDLEMMKTPTTSKRTTNTCDVEASCSYCLKHIKISNTYRKQYNILKKQNNFLRLKLREFRKRYIRAINKKGFDELVKRQCVSEESKTFLEILLRKSKYSGFSDSQRNLAQGLYFTSPGCYRYMRSCLNFPLPSRISILNWMPIKNVFPGENENIIFQISKKLLSMPQEQRCAILLYDEMKIRCDLEYDKHNDIIHGYVDLGGHREHKVATHVLTFMVRGIFSKYKYPISYYAAENGVSGHDLTKLITHNIEMARKMGFDIRATICDQGSNNRKAYKTFGVSCNKPEYNIGNKKVLALYDGPHLFKSLRNNIMVADIITPDGIGSWKVIVELFEMERRSTTKLCPKLQEKHIYPTNMQKMTVSLAIQIFSNTVAAAIRTNYSLGKFSDPVKPHVIPTAIFIEKLNKLWDNINSSELYPRNPHKQPLKHNNAIYKNIKEMANYLKKIRFNKKTKDFCIDGLIMTLNGMLILADDVFRDHPTFDYIFTKRLDQDALENTFAVTRGKGGFCRNPSILEFSRIFAQISCIKLLKNTNFSNCVDDDDELLMTVQDLQNMSEEINGTDTCDSVVISETHEQTCMDETDDVAYLENIVLADGYSYLQNDEDDASLKYFIGYVFYKFNKTNKCIDCEHFLIKSSETMTMENEYFIYYKNYKSNTVFGNLHPPTEEFFEASKHFVYIFQEVFNKNPHITNIKDFIVKNCIELVVKGAISSNFLKSSNKCYDHHLQMLDHMILVLLRKHCKWAIKKNNTKQKLTIINQ